jgi:hypothetical protein
MLWRNEETTLAVKLGMAWWARSSQVICKERSRTWSLTFLGGRVEIYSEWKALEVTFLRLPTATPGWEAEDLNQEVREVLVHRGGGFSSIEASTNGGDVGPEAYLLGQITGRVPPCQAVTGLLGQQGLIPTWDGGEADATRREADVELIMGQPLLVAPPQKITDGMAKKSRCCIREWQDLGQVPRP